MFNKKIRSRSGFSSQTRGSLSTTLFQKSELQNNPESESESEDQNQRIRIRGSESGSVSGSKSGSESGSELEPEDHSAQHSFKSQNNPETESSEVCLLSDHNQYPEVPSSRDRAQNP